MALKPELEVVKKLLILTAFFCSIIGQTETYEEYTKRINEITHSVEVGETLEKILLSRGYEKIDGPWGARKQTLLKNGLSDGEILTPGSILILPYSPGESENYKQRSLAADKSYDLGEPLDIGTKMSPNISKEIPTVEYVDPEPIKEEPLKVETETKVIEKEVIKKVVKQKIVYIDKSTEDYENWSHLRFFLGNKFTKISLDDPISGNAKLDSQYHFEYGLRWTQKWDKNFYFFSQLSVEMLSFDKPQGTSFNKARFFLPAMELGAQYTTGNERLSFSFLYQSEAQALTKVNSVLALTSTEVSSLVFGYERVMESKKFFKFVGEVSLGYVIPMENNGVEIEDGYNFKIGGTIRYQKPEYRFEFKPYFNWSQKNTNLTEEKRRSFGIQFGYGKDF